LAVVARRLDRPVQLRTIRVEDVERIGLPGHRKCRPGWKPPERPERAQPPYDLLRSGLNGPDCVSAIDCPSRRTSDRAAVQVLAGPHPPAR
jgi:hypothetical protein